MSFSNIIITMAAHIARYNMTDFNRILFDGFQYGLDSEIITIIQSLADQVGAPEYVRTPQFPKRERGARRGEAGRRGRNKAQEITDEDWEIIREFQATEIKKKEGIDASIDNIRKHLNKISDKTYETLLGEIIVEISKITQEANPEGDVLIELHKVGDAIFNIASSNAFYSEMYAELYKSLMEEHSFMANIFEKNFITFSAIFKTIEYCNPDDDYDKYCEINKTNEKRRAVSLFYVNLMKKDIIPRKSIISIIMEVQEYMKNLMKSEENKPIVDELSEVIYILVVNSVSVLKDNDEWEDIMNIISNISKMSNKSKPGITNKTIFKHMDIMEELD